MKLFASAEDTLIENSVITTICAPLSEYRTSLVSASKDMEYTTPESALATPSDTHARIQAKEIAKTYGSGVRTVVLVGIGGSDLGTRAVYEAIPRDSTSPTLVSFDTVNPMHLQEAERLFVRTKHPEEVVMVVVTKSGTTVETLTNANILFRLFKKHHPAHAHKQTVIITNEGAPLLDKVKAQGMRTASIPIHVGGRYSVFTSVGLVPLALLGIDIDAFCDGGNAAVEMLLATKHISVAQLYAATLFAHFREGKEIHEMFIFNPRLHTLGKWYRQLLAESVGKHDAGGAAVGIMPSIAIGSTDLHSLGQLIFGGPRNRFTTFMGTPDEWSTHTSSLDETSLFFMPSLKGANTGAVIRAIYDGVRDTYRAQSLPFMTYNFDNRTAREVGVFMATHMIMVMYLGRLLHVDAFNQPAVEMYKARVRTLLEQK